MSSGCWRCDTGYDHTPSVCSRAQTIVEEDTPMPKPNPTRLTRRFTYRMRVRFDDHEFNIGKLEIDRAREMVQGTIESVQAGAADFPSRPRDVSLMRDDSEDLDNATLYTFDFLTR